jgi:hypothetical protein
MANVDTNVANYSLTELLDIVGIENDEIEPDMIESKTNKLINRFKKSQPNLSFFFMDVQTELLNYVKGLQTHFYDSDEDSIQLLSDEASSEKIHVEGFGNMNSSDNSAKYPPGEKQITDWYQNEYLTQSDSNQVNKITDRKQKIELFGNESVPMNRQQVATTDTYNLPVKQDSLNPNLKNTIKRFVNLDSQFRQYANNQDSTSTDYTLDLSDTLKDALSLSVYSYQIPFSWYVIDDAYGNTCFWIHDPATSQDINVYVPPGNYSATSFQTQLNTSFLNAGITTPAVPSPYNLPANSPTYYNTSNGIITLFLYDGSYNDPAGINPSFNITSSCSIIFYDFTGYLLCKGTCLSKSNHYFNNTLGWVMGYRLPYLSILPDGNTGSSILDLNGTKYLILVIDDYNQNHVNNSLVSITQTANNLKMPSYYSPDIPYTCITPEQRGNNLQQIVDQVVTQSVFDNQTINAQNGLLIGAKYQQEYSNTQQVLPSAPRTLTQPQLYTINEINKHNSNLTNYLSKAPTTSDIMGILPVKTSVGIPIGTLLVEFSGSLQDNTRTYFGPVDIDRMNVKLLDDKGNVLNLNGNDWCVTLVCQCLYQY